MTDLAAAKDALRADMRARLAALKPLERALEEEVVNAAVQATPEWTAARTVLLYKAKAPELSVVYLGNAALRTGKRLVLPRVADRATGALGLHHVADWLQLEKGAFGLMEPRADLPVVAPEEVELAVVPGLAWDAAGGRLGQGGGFFDRLLPHLGGPAWGVGFDCQVVDEVPREPHDAAVERAWTMGSIVGP
ncbi:MAG: 5-formyltetrahydrofolate cyclo-ligase [Thermoplasmatota archaeon]